MNDNSIRENKPLPFTSYPFNGRKLIGRVSGDNCRHGYGLKFMRVTGQTICAYCGLDLAATYENWLSMALDHVIPHSTCLAWELPEEWREDQSNRVLCCTTCNTFGNRYAPLEFERPSTLDEFFDIRDAIFAERKRNILERHRIERAFYDRKPWAP